MPSLDTFLNPILSRRTIANFVPRRAILDALTARLDAFQGIVLDIGCGQKPYKPLLLAPPTRITKYIGLDLNDQLRHPAYAYCDRPDLEWDGRTIPLDNDSIDCAIATEVLHQCPQPETLMAEANRVLKPGGIFFFTVPFLWVIHDAPSDQGRPTPFALERQLRNSGFEEIRTQAFGGWDASLAQMLGLWVARRPRGRIRRAILAGISLPIMKYLLNKDEPPSHYEQTIMITGIAGTAIKPSFSK